MTQNRIYLSSPHLSGNEQKYISEAFATNWIAPLGPNVDGFEREIAQYAGVKGAAAVSSGTAAIHLALQLIGVTKGDTVFCQSFTFVASANPIIYQGAQPVFIDSEPETWNMSPQALERALLHAKKEGKLPKAVISVNLYGQSAKMDEIVSLCDQYGVALVDDAAESLGSYYKGKMTGTFGRFGIYSFNGNKIITTSGGGMLVSNDEAALEKARFLATQARDVAPYYQHSQLGYNYRMSNILAGLGRSQLEVIEDRVDARRAVYNRYVEELGHIDGISFMPELAGTKSNRWLTALTLDLAKINTTPVEIAQELAKENIEARPVWKPLHLQPLFDGTKFYFHDKDQAVCEQLFETGLCLPSGSNMSLEDQNRVIEVLAETLNKKNAISEIA
ncbi:aminotransferase class I/II-fold pyridoxal phosphate-dependent enzyme [Bacillus sp. DNRA2]|uniref:aminotransferase class I/II-fold pyridoxal phosphate-dependent enzyme n=1 Tax=Bacillus sp. DNRA2 TaxID=2723053 RepID=UPI00145E4F51|nr:aminotransferase class I/II-fold pyridoxal phosphate-dependent enzyme [Bacillus sp. DNRA2]NMD70159.1 aminotransferase class I/II-fold pyridoxal phosphate-dependent enzyme [Bacillus sp. DNRA2]